MRKIYTHPDLAMVQLAKNELQNRGIDSVIRGEHLASVAGGGASFDAWVELWVVDDARLQEAAQTIQETFDHTAAEEAGEPWTCPNCGETLEAQFAVCWNCGHERPD